MGSRRPDRRAAVTPDSSGRRSLWHRQSGTTRGRRPKEVLCPDCFRTFPVWKMRFRYVPRLNGPDVQKTYPLPRAWWARLYPFCRLRQPFPWGPEGRRFEEKICAFEDCRSPLPYTAGLERTLVIVLVGGAAAGKTCYLVSLIRHFMSSHWLTLLPLDDATSARFKREVERLYGEHYALPRTVPTPYPPLLYRIISPAGSGSRQSCTLVLCEDIQPRWSLTYREELFEPNYRCLTQADGLLFLIDPLQCAELGEHLGCEARGVRAYDILDVLVRHLKRGALGVGGTEKIGIPLAVAFAKADLLQDAGLIEPQSVWRLPVFHEGQYDLGLHDEMDQVWSSLMARYESLLSRTVAAHFQDYAFFGVSATGCSAVNGEFPRMAPHRVEEPLLWLLYRLGGIGARQG